MGSNSVFSNQDLRNYERSATCCGSEAEGRWPGPTGGSVEFLFRQVPVLFPIGSRREIVAAVGSER